MMERRPVILTRPLADARPLATEIRQADPSLAVHIAPLIAITTLPHSITGLTHGTSLILTSANAIRSLDAAADLVGMTAWCVGPRTGTAARQRGLDVRIATGSAHALIELLLTERPDDKLIYLRGKHIAVPLTERLAKAGLATQEIITYDQVGLPMPTAVRSLMGRQACLVSLHSARTARIFVSQAKSLPRRDHILLCQSATIAATADPVWATHVLRDGEDWVQAVRTLA